MHGPRPLLTLAAALTVLGGALALCFYDREDADTSAAATGPPPTTSTAPAGSLSGWPVSRPAVVPGSADERTAVPKPDTDTWLVTGRVIRRREVQKPNGELEDELLPIHKATVQARLERGETWREVARAVTGADGDFELSLDGLKGLSALARIHGKLQVRAWADGHAPCNGETFALPRAPTQPFRKRASLELEPATTLVGRVLDARSKPVHLVSMHVDGEYLGQTDEAGCYHLVLEKPGTVEVVAARDGVGVSDPVKVEVAKDQTVQVEDIVLQEGNVIAGQAVYPDGSPACNLMLSLSWDKRQGEKPYLDYIASQADVTTDAAGRFRAGGLVKGSYQVQAFRTGTPRPGTFVRTGTPNARVVIRDHFLLVSAHDQEGRPVPGAQVTLLGWRGAAAERAREHFERRGNFIGVYDSACHRSELYFEDRAAQDWVVEPDTFWALCPATDGSRESVQTVQVTKEQHCYPVELTLSSSADTGLLEISIRDGKGRMVRGYCASLHSVTTVRPLPDYDSIYPPEPDTGIQVPAGEFLLKVLPMPASQHGDQGYSFVPCQWIERRILVRPDSEQSLRLVATPAAGLALRIKPAAGKNVGWSPDGLRVTLTPLSGGPTYIARRFLPSNAIGPRWHPWCSSTGGGTDLVDCTVPPGRYQVELRAPGLVPIMRTIDLEIGRIALLEGQFTAR